MRESSYIAFTRQLKVDRVLGSIVDIKTEAIRDALFQRLIHEAAGKADEIYGEALVGLAERKDTRLINPLLKELSSNQVGRLAIEAASIMGDPRLYCALIRLRDRSDLDSDLLEKPLSVPSTKLGRG